MEDHVFRCRHCKRILRKRGREQTYCGQGVCQKARKKRWRRAKYRLDPDYRANQRESTHAWLKSQGGAAAYYRRYRRRRKAQRHEVRRSDDVDHATQAGTSVENANSDAKTHQSLVRSGRYRLLPCGSANSDAVLVDLFVVSVG